MSGSDFKLTESTREVFTCERGTVQFYFVDADKDVGKIFLYTVKALYWTAVINGLLAPFLLVAILIVASDKKLMQGQPSSRFGWIVVAITTVAMFAAGMAMFVV
jgi:hypothetical protein